MGGLRAGVAWMVMMGIAGSPVLAVAQAAGPSPTTNPNPNPTPNPNPNPSPIPIPNPNPNPNPSPSPSPSPSPTSTPTPTPLPASPADALRLANTAAQLGDWAEVERLVAPLVAPSSSASPIPLTPADRAEAHRLRGLAAFFTQRIPLAEAELLAYLRLDVDAHLDPATVPPEAITFFESVQAKHRAELRTLRAEKSRQPPRRSLLLAFVPVAGQLQNRAPRKAIGFGVALGALAITNVSTYLVLRSWCEREDGVCEKGGEDRTDSAKRLSIVNLLSGVGLVVVGGVAVYDSLVGYRRSLRITPIAGEGTVGVSASGHF